MPGDDLHDEAPRASKPRHAAPRKQLLPRLHVPAGKAVAMAAMPTAVLMGMGLTPQLAVAKPPQVENPFRDGPCVPEEDQKEAEQAAEKKAEEKKEAERAARAQAAEKARRLAEQREARRRAAAEAVEKQRRRTEQQRREAAESQQSEDASASTGRQEDSSASQERNPLDPLGIGEAIRDLFTPDRDEQDDKQDDKQDKQDRQDRQGDKQNGSERDTSTGRSSDASDDDRSKSPVDDAGKGLRDTADRLGRGAEDADEDVTGREGTDDKESERAGDRAGTDEEGKKPFPCVEEKKDPGTDERTPVVLPNQPWYLRASYITLRGLKYHGVVNVTMANGRTKQALKFTAESVDIGDLHQIVDGPNGVKYHVRAGEGATSTFRGGTVTMYTEELDAKLFGAIPVVFDPEHPPPLDVPFAVFTDVKLRQAGQFGGNLTIPGLHSSITRD